MALRSSWKAQLFPSIAFDYSRYVYLILWVFFCFFCCSSCISFRMVWQQVVAVPRIDCRLNSNGISKTEGKSPSYCHSERQSSSWECWRKKQAFEECYRGAIHDLLLKWIIFILLILTVFFCCCFIPDQSIAVKALQHYDNMIINFEPNWLLSLKERKRGRNSKKFLRIWWNGTIRRTHFYCLVILISVSVILTNQFFQIQ